VSALSVGATRTNKAAHIDDSNAPVIESGPTDEGNAMKRLSGAVTAIILGSSVISIANAASFSTIKFDGSRGQNPTGSLLDDRHGALFSTVYFFGPGGHGAVFKLTPPGQEGGKWNYTGLYAFTGGADGGYPVGGLVKDEAGNFFGVVSQGGANNAGGVFMLSPPQHGQETWTETIVYSFISSQDFANGELLRDGAGNLYGATAKDVYRLGPPTDGSNNWVPTILHTFTGGADGASATGGLAGDSTGLYGTTRGGGSTNSGTVYQLTPPTSGETWIKTILHDFSGTDGANPNGELVRKNGAIYGGVSAGGAFDSGAIYRLKPPKSEGGKWRYQVLYNFSGADGALQWSGVTLGKHCLVYGSTVDGGIFGNHSRGVIFSLAPPAAGEQQWSETVLYGFSNKGENSPGPLLLDRHGTLLGTAQYGAASNTGTIFQVLP